MECLRTRRSFIGTNQLRQLAQITGLFTGTKAKVRGWCERGRRSCRRSGPFRPWNHASFSWGKFTVFLVKIPLRLPIGTLTIYKFVRGTSPLDRPIHIYRTVGIDTCSCVWLTRIRIHTIHQETLQLRNLRRRHDNRIFQDAPVNNAARNTRRLRRASFVAEIVVSPGMNVPIIWIKDSLKVREIELLIGGIRRIG